MRKKPTKRPSTTSGKAPAKPKAKAPPRTKRKSRKSKPKQDQQAAELSFPASVDPAKLIPQFKIPSRDKRVGRVSVLEHIIRYDPNTYNRMLLFIRLGGYAWVAAEAMGISAEQFCRWLARGARETEGIYYQFHQDVTRAQAMARLMVELKVQEDNPEFWLRCGPGRSADRIAPPRLAKNRRTKQYKLLRALDLPGWTQQEEANKEPLNVTLNFGGENVKESPVDATNLGQALNMMVDMGLIEIKPGLHKVMEAQSKGLSVTIDDLESESQNESESNGHAP